MPSKQQFTSEETAFFKLDVALFTCHSIIPEIFIMLNMKYIFINMLNYEILMLKVFTITSNSPSKSLIELKAAI